MPIKIGSVKAGSVGASVAGASVAAGSVAGASVAGASVGPVSGMISVAVEGAPHAVRIITKTRKVGMILQVIPFFLFIHPPISKISFQGTNKTFLNYFKSLSFLR
jgi:hypothetical protein